MTALVASRASLERGLETAEAVLGAGGVALTDWPALAAEPGLAARFTHVVLADPAPSAALARVAACAGPGGGGFLHVFGEQRDTELAVRALSLSYPDRAMLGSLYRALRDRLGGSAPLGQWWDVVAEALPVGSVELVARGLRVLADLGVLRVTGEAHARAVEAVSSESSKLEECASYGAYRNAHEECVRFLTQGGKPS